MNDIQNDIQIMHSLATEVSDTIRQPIDIAEKEQKIKELLKDIDGEIIIEKYIVNGVEHISRVDLEPKRVNMFEQLDCTKANPTLIALSKLYTAYLLCEHTGDSEQLYKALLDYELVTHYPVTKCSPYDKEWMMVEASVILDSTLVQPQSTSQSDNEIVKVIKKVFPEAQVKSWF